MTAVVSVVFGRTARLLKHPLPVPLRSGLLSRRREGPTIRGFIDEAQCGESFPTFRFYSTECALPDPFNLTHIRVTLPLTLFHERPASFVIEIDLWGSFAGRQRISVSRRWDLRDQVPAPRSRSTYTCRYIPRGILGEMFQVKSDPFETKRTSPALKI